MWAEREEIPGLGEQGAPGHPGTQISRMSHLVTPGSLVSETVYWTSEGELKPGFIVS